MVALVHQCVEFPVRRLKDLIQVLLALFFLVFIGNLLVESILDL